VTKKRVGKFPKAFRQMAVDRLTQCDNIVALAKELGISRRLLYTWREKLEPMERGEGPPATSRESTLRHEVSRLKRVLAEKVLEVDFFTGALQKVEARRQRSGKAGAQASTPRSGT
jgi:transposase-like protein